MVGKEAQTGARIKLKDFTCEAGALGQVESGLCAAPGWGFPGGSVVKNPPASAEVAGSTSGSGRSPGEGNGNPLQLFLPGEFHGQKNLMGYRPRGRKQSHTTE